MSTKILSALLIAGVSALSVPAFADTNPNDQPKIFDRDAASIVATLDQKGINARDVEQWGNYVRAYVTDDAGKTTMQFFDQDQLNRVVLN